jgi:hypothetical protein
LRHGRSNPQHSDGKESGFHVFSGLFWCSLLHTLSVLFGCSCGTNVEARVSAGGNQSLKIVMHLNARPGLSVDRQGTCRAGMRLRPRQCHDCFETTHRQIAQNEGAAMGLDDIPRDAQSQSTAARIAIPRRFEPVERLKHALQLIFRYSRSVIAYPNHER